MAQRIWLYKNLNGAVFEIGLYHGDESGHVMIYVGKEILQIDFNVKIKKDYRFMLDDELFKLTYYPDKPYKYELFNETQHKEIPLIGKALRNPNQSLMMALTIIFVILVLLSILLLALSVLIE